MPTPTSEEMEKRAVRALSVVGEDDCNPLECGERCEAYGFPICRLEVLALTEALTTAYNDGVAEREQATEGLG